MPARAASPRSSSSRWRTSSTRRRFRRGSTPGTSWSSRSAGPGRPPRRGVRRRARRVQGRHPAAGHRVGVVRVRGGLGRPPPHLRAGRHHGVALRPRPRELAARVGARAGTGPAPCRWPARGTPSVPLRPSTCGTRARFTRSRWGSTRCRSDGTSSIACKSGSRRSTNGSTAAARHSPGRDWRSSPRGAGRRRRRRSPPS